MSLTKKAIFCLFLWCAIASCGPADSEIELPIYHDLHLELAKVDTENIPAAMRQLTDKYGKFFPFFLDEIANLDTSEDFTDTVLQEFFIHPDLRALHDTVAQVYASTKDIQGDINRMLQAVDRIDSNLTLPSEVFFYTSGLNHVAFTYADTILAVGLDRFFGSNFWPYEARGYPAYTTRTLVKENIALEAAKNIYLNKYAISPQDKTLLDLMVHEGKMLCFLEEVFPKKEMHTIIGFTREQWEWCEDNEVQIYKFFLDQKLLYEKSTMKTMRYIAPTPTSMGMPDQSPGRTGCYIGYRIVRAYLKHSGKSIAETLQENLPAQTVLQISKYKPKR